MEPANAWERAQEAIARAEERDADVITPDNAVSPFDASATMIIPSMGAAPRRPAPGAPRPYPPAPRRPGDGGGPFEPPTMPVEVSDPGTYTARSGHSGRPSTSPFPAAGTGAAPVADADDDDADTSPERPVPAPRSTRPRWRRLFRRS